MSGNEGAGINVQPGANGQTIQGNLIGLNAAGSAAIPNGDAGILVTGASNVTIGGTTGTTPGVRTPNGN